MSETIRETSGRIRDTQRATDFIRDEMTLTGGVVRTPDPIVKVEPTSQLADAQQLASDIFSDPFGSLMGVAGFVTNPIGSILNPATNPVTKIVDAVTGGGLTKGAEGIIDQVPFLGPLAGMADMAGFMADPIGFLKANPQMILILGGVLIGGIILLKVIF